MYLSDRIVHRKAIGRRVGVADPQRQIDGSIMFQLLWTHPRRQFRKRLDLKQRMACKAMGKMRRQGGIGCGKRLMRIITIPRLLEDPKK